MSRARSNTSASNLPPNLNEALQDSFLSGSKPSFNLIKPIILLLTNNAYEEDDNTKLIQIDDSKVQEVIKVAIEALKVGSFTSTQHESYVNDKIYGPLLIGLVELFGEAIRVRVTDKIFAEDMKRLGFGKPIITILSQTLSTSRVELELAGRTHRAVLPSLTNLDWRVDVAITTTHLNKVFKPSVLMQATTTHGQIKTFELSVDKFNQLRYSVARMLAAMQNIEQHPTLMRLVD